MKTLLVLAVAFSLVIFRPAPPYAGTGPDLKEIIGLIEQGLTTEAEKILTSSGQKTPLSDKDRFKAFYLLGLGYLNELNFKKAAEIFDLIPARSGPGLRAAFLAKECRRADDIRKDSPFIAASLTILLPGLGQLYLGRYTDAAWSAVTTLIPFAAAVAGLWAGSAVLFVPAGLATLAFFGGSIYNALNQAHRGNRSRLKKFSSELTSRASALPGEP